MAAYHIPRRAVTKINTCVYAESICAREAPACGLGEQVARLSL